MQLGDGQFRTFTSRRKGSFTLSHVSSLLCLDAAMSEAPPACRGFIFATGFFFTLSCVCCKYEQW
jgi:hypothetical protein